jgi:hypothetical protein
MSLPEGITWFDCLKIYIVGDIAYSIGFILVGILISLFRSEEK